MIPEALQRDDALKAHRAALHLETLIPFIRSDVVVDLVGVGNVFCHLTVAASPFLSAPIIAALVEIAERDVIVVLLRNHRLAFPAWLMSRVIDRFGDDDDILLACESRDDLADEAVLVVFDSRLRWIEKNSPCLHGLADCDHRESVIVIALWASPADLREIYCKALAQSGRLTSALLLFAFAIGARDVALCLFAHAAHVKVTAIDDAITKRQVGIIRNFAQKARVAEILIPELIEAIDDLEPSEEPLSLVA